LTSAATECEYPAKVKPELLQAIDLALSGQWNEAHEIVQQYEDPTAAWIHAVLHKKETRRRAGIGVLVSPGWETGALF
jgi:hypothetical protein